MPNTPTPEYIKARMAQISAACEAQDGNLALAVVDLVKADGYPRLADQILDGLVNKGLHNLASKARTR